MRSSKIKASDRWRLWEFDILNGLYHYTVEVYKWIVQALFISSDFWLRWLVHEVWHGIRAQGLDFESWFSQFIVKLLLPPFVSTCWLSLLPSHVSGDVEVYKWIVQALSISSDFWLRWLVYEAWHIQASGCSTLYFQMKMALLTI
jgi:hypothetical protein